MIQDPAPKLPLRVLFFQEGKDLAGNYYKNSPGLLPMIDDVRKRGFNISFYIDGEQLLKDCLDPGVDVVAISTVERQLARTVELARKIREVGYSSVLMIGGKTINHYIEKLSQELFDITVGEEGEHIFPALLYKISAWRGKGPNTIGLTPEKLYPSQITRLENGETGGAIDDQGIGFLLDASFERLGCRIGISNVCVRNGKTGEVYRFNPPKTETIENNLKLDCCPDEYELQHMFNIPWDIMTQYGWKTLEIYTQRGCSWSRCVFCSISKTPVRSLTHENILCAVRVAADQGITSVSFADDMFIQDSTWSRGLLESLIESHTGIRFRAQTCPTKAVWKLLDSMAQAGFDELSYGVETLLGDRAVFLGKSNNGAKYVENAKATILRTASAGIIPVLYMILVDPRSSLEEITLDLLECAKLLSDVYHRTSVLPKISWSLVLLPVSGGMLGKEFSFSTTAVNLGNRSFGVPSDYDLPEILAVLIRKIVQTTEGLPSGRDSFETLEGLLIAARDVSREFNLDQAYQNALEGLEIYHGLRKSLLSDIMMTAEEVYEVQMNPDPDWWHDPAMMRFNYLRFASFQEGLEKYVGLIQNHKMT